MELTERTYELTRAFPKEETFGLTSQLRRAAVSVPANIAEGWGRQTPGEFQQHLRVAQGSLRELETHLLLSVRLGFTPQDRVAPVLESCSVIGRQLIQLQRRLRDKARK